MFSRLYTKSELIKLTKQIIPPLLPSYYKGQCGKIAIIGGCEDYTGAPFFSAHAAATLGCDLTHVICERSAATVIKSYSPDLMVHPYLKDSNALEQYMITTGKKLDRLNERSFQAEYVKEKVMPKVITILDRIQAVVVGPGFGRDPVMLLTLEFILDEIKARHLPVILDADALYLVSQKPNVIRGYSNAILTPNIVEYRRICKAVNIKDADNTKEVHLLSKAMNVTVLQKGNKDLIVCGDDEIVNDEAGSCKRVGGQGDSLTGLISTFLAWGYSAYKDKIWPEAKRSTPQFTNEQIRMLACYGGALLTKKSAGKAFTKYGRSMQTSDLHKYILESYNEVFGI
ncbi:hypothetical protein BRETT_000737 [Brettanomyces bruxellensis]|uniref:ATP-dependent (S)-NAD(P)H-hydrate dehydratase n=1 Tax=Dekkera bruxellensis TaxID=5007 RepID=A0A871RG23_DEKBR|nr:uncharacterized protein BRETT_000737 [Brettanomyces bruxellensis]QOU21020.1 hypothetical protein BRETT_000737 [Brettanomyces bruxellensis]